MTAPTTLPAGRIMCPGWTSEYAPGQTFECGAPNGGRRKADPSLILELSGACARCRRQKVKYDEEHGAKEGREKRKVTDPGAGGRMRRRRAAAYRAAMVKRKGGPFRTRLTAPTSTRDSGDRRTKRPPVTIECTVEGCRWTGTARSWRLARVERDAHRAEKHR